MLAPALASLSLVAAPQDPAPGIDRELARQRAALVSEVEYDLRFQLTAGAHEVLGRATIRFRLPEDRDLAAPLVLDFQGNDLADVTVNSRSATLPAVHDHVLLPNDLLARGANVLTMTFRSAVAPTGTPLTVYHDDVDDRDYYYTLVVPADAHRLYPCFDQPDLRARFTFELDLPPTWTAVANTAPLPAAARRDDDVAGRLWCFAPTKPLPTYLAAFACGPFASFEAPPPAVPGITSREPMRFLLRESQVPLADRDTLIRLHHDGLRWLERQFDVPYAFDKLDVVLLPGFPYGGMEHAGAIFYREQALVFDHPPTAAELVRRSTLVYHELSHQWFGNLVTMRWFDDLWLKEGFATFVGYQALQALEPEQKAWLRFLQRVKPRAYEVDATPGTTPVFQALQNLADAKSAYGAIVYNKAPAVLRDLHDRVGADAFRRGLKRYLERHAFGNAEWTDLAAAIDDEASADLRPWWQRWILVPSMPQVRVEWTSGADGATTAAALTQRATSGDGTWPLDVELLALFADGGRELVRVQGDTARIEVPALAGRRLAAVLVNPRDVAYGQFVPDPQSRDWLCDHAPELADPLERAAATQALFEAVREAELDPLRFADVALRQLAAERDPDTHGWLLDSLRTTLLRYVPAERSAAARARATTLLLGQLRDEAGSGRELATFRFLAETSGDAAVLDLCARVIDDHDLPPGLAPGKLDCFLAAAARINAGIDTDELDRLGRRFAGVDVQKERFLARAATPDAAVKAEYWQQYLQLDTPPEQWTQDSLSWFHWAGQGPLTLPYLQLALDRVDWVKQHRRIFFMPAWLDAFVNGHSSPVALAIVDEFLATHTLTDDVRRKLLQSRDGLARAVRIRAAFASPPDAK